MAIDARPRSCPEKRWTINRPHLLHPAGSPLDCPYRLGLKFQLQRRIARLPGASARTIVTEPGRDFAVAKIQDPGASRLRKAWATMPPRPFPKFRLAALTQRVILFRSMHDQVPTLERRGSLLRPQSWVRPQIGEAYSLQFVPDWQQMSARWHRTLQDRSDWVRVRRSRLSRYRVRILAS